MQSFGFYDHVGNDESVRTASSTVSRGSQSSPDSSGVTISSSVTPEELSDIFRISCRPKLLVHIKSAQRLGFGLFKPMLLIPKPSLQLRRASQKVCAIARVRFGAFDVSVCVIESAFLGKHLRQGIMGPKRSTVQVERRRDFKGYLVVVNGPLSLALGVIDMSKNTMTMADPELFAFLREEFDRAGCGSLQRRVDRHHTAHRQG